MENCSPLIQLNIFPSRNMMHLYLQKGLIKLTNGEYFIEPLKGHEPKPGEDKPHPHVVYKRQTLNLNSDDTSYPRIERDTCGNRGNHARDKSKNFAK